MTKQQNIGKKAGLFSLIVSVILIIDQLSKAYIRSNFQVGEGVPIIKNILHILYLQNRGAAFGMLQGAGIYFVIVAVVTVVVLAVFMARSKQISKTEIVALSFIIAGAVGNLIDRLWHGFVTDFIYAKVINFPVFNIADCAVSIGTVLFIGWILFSPNSDKSSSVEDSSRAAARKIRQDEQDEATK